MSYDVTRWPPRKPRPNDWTPEQHAVLIELAGKAPVNEIAERVGRTPQAVRGHAAHFGISLRPEGKPHNWNQVWTPDDIGRLARLARTHTRAEAAAILERGARTVAWKAGELGISFLRYGERHPRTRYPRTIVRQIAEMQALGYTTRQTARLLRIPYDYAYRVRSSRVRWRETMDVEVVP